MTERGARYLLRFDDLYPTIDRVGWASFERLVREFQIRPSLAIVPENQDPDLRQDKADELFWESMRSLQESGAAIALLGYRHRCVSDGRSLLPLHRLTEFAGVPAAMQSAWIEQGTRIFREHGLEPKVFVAPRHGLDHGTLQALRAAGITAISDGFGRRPTVHHGIAWIPQQLWGPARKKRVYGQSASIAIKRPRGKYSRWRSSCGNTKLSVSAWRRRCGSRSRVGRDLCAELDGGAILENPAQASGSTKKPLAASGLNEGLGV